MSVDQAHVIDAIGVDKVTGDLVLTISDHLEWTGNDNEHLLLLQEKLNTYLGFVEGGEIFRTYPDAKGRAVLIDVVCKFPLNQEAENFYSHITSIVEGAGIKLQHRTFNAA